MIKFREFELNCESYELRRNGRPVKLEKLPMELLILLASKNGLLVTRPEIAERLWGSEVFVDREHGINTAVRKLRQALRDDPDKPRFVVTVTGKGYRFVMQSIDVDVPAVAQKHDPTVSTNSTPADPVLTNHFATNHVSSNHIPANDANNDAREDLPIWLLSAVGVLVLSLAGVVWYLLRPLPQPRITGYTQITHDGVPRWVVGTDGIRLYGDQYLPAGYSSAQIAISSGEVTNLPIALPGRHGICCVSPDGGTLLLWLDPGTLWTTSTQGGSLRRLTAKQTDSEAWSPDGRSIIYTADHGDFYVMRSDGSDVRKLASVGGYVVDISWSPDGKTIRYTKDDALWEMTSSGSNPHRLLPAWPASSGLCCGHWTPDGKFFLFLEGRENLTHLGANAQMGQLWALDERRKLFRRPTAEPVKLTADAIGWWDPVPSKDGRKVFARGVTPRGELLRYDPGTKLIQPYLGGISAEFVTFSPDGKSLAYVTFPEGILWRANRDGSGPVQMTDPPMYPILPRWSPDGSQIVFTASSGMHGHDVMFVVSAQGGKPWRLLPRENGQEADPNWSPDGRKVVFWDGVHNDIRILDIASHQVTTLPGSDRLFSPRWSPNGRTITTYDHDIRRGKNFDIETQRWTILPKATRPGLFNEWSSDSRFIYTLSLGDNPGVFRINVEKNRLEPVVGLKGFRHTGYIDAWMGLDPSGAPLILRDAGLTEIYALTLEAK